MQSKKELKKQIEEYWEDPNTASLIDKNLYKIEIDTACRYLLPSDCLADIGCGDAEATIQYATKVRNCTGFEKSTYLRSKAIETIRRSGLKNINIKYGDLLEMDNLLDKFDVVITQRMLINLMSWDDQQRGIINIYNFLKPYGRYIMIENTNDGLVALNDMRFKVGLKPVPKHWHNHYFDYEKLMVFLEDKFKLINFHEFGLYYFLTRVYVQMFASFTGFGKNAKKDSLFIESDQAARIIYEKFRDHLRISGGHAFGPIQAFILQRK